MGELHNKMTALADNIRALSGQSGTLSIDDMIAATTGVSGGDDIYKRVLYRDPTLLSYSDGATVAPRDMFDGMNIQSLSMPNLLVAPVEFCFNCKKLTNVDISSCTLISDGAFRGCTSLSEIVLPNSLITIHSNVFRDTTIKEITIPSNVTTMGNYLFVGSGLQTVNFNAENCAYNDYAFYGSNPTTLNLGPNVNIIPSLKSSTTVNFADGATIVPADGFKSWTKITTVSLPKTIENIGESAFSGCTKLTTFIIRETSDLNSLIKLNNTNSFTQISNNAKFYVPDEFVDAYKAADNWSYYADKIYPISNYVETT